MKWFKHMTNMRHDVRLKRVIKKFGLKGYGLYNTIIESIAEALTNDDPLPDLEENAQDIAEYYNEDTVNINEMMIYMVEQNLFSQADITERLICNKIYKFIEKSQTRSLEMREMIDKFKNMTTECPRLSQTVSNNPDTVQYNTIDKNRIDKKTYGAIHNVLLTLEEASRLIEEYGLKITNMYIEKLSTYIPNKPGKPYKDHNAAIRSWLRKDNILKLEENKVTYKDDKYEPDEVIMK